MALRDVSTPLASEIIPVVEERLAAAKDESSPETVRVQWRGEDRNFHVVSMPVSMLYLNPNTHRIRAQRALSPRRDMLLEQHPWSDDGQLYLKELLRAKPSDPTQPDPDFQILMDELSRDGQLAAGLITRTGILVDGNTRGVALKDLGVDHMRVGVLPADATWADISATELRIQLRKDKRRDYPYVNQLISIDEQLTNGRTQRDVAAEWNIKDSTLEADMWIFQFIHEAVERSQTTDGNQLTLLAFNDQRESLRELYRHYNAARKSNSEAAEQLREARLAAIILGLPKTSLRHVEGDFYTRYLEKRLPTTLKPEPSAPEDLVIPGLDVAVPDHSDAARAAKALTDALLRSHADLNAGGDAAQQAASAIAEADKVFRDAARMAGADASLRKKQSAVPDRVQEATDLIEQAADEIARSRADRTLDLEAFDAVLLELRSGLERLAKQAVRGNDEPGEGTAWLLEAIQS